jgi:uncharacterized membrane protein YkvA (DUF1232 family)
MTTSESRPPLSQLAAGTLRMLPHLGKLFAGVVRDPRVPRIAKVQAGALVAIGLSPIDAIPVLGQTELVAAIALAARQLLKHSDEAVLRDHWTGTDRQFRTLLWLADTGLHPGRMAMRLLGGAVRGRRRR